MDRIKVAFRDFSSDSDPTQQALIRSLAAHFELVLSDDPDFTFFSVWGRRHLLDRGIKIFISAENFPWTFAHCDYAITSDLVDDPRHYRLPVYARYVSDPARLKKEDRDPEAILKEKTGFCNFVYSNAAPEVRVRFFEKLSRYKHVDSGGSHLNNLGYRVSDKLRFIRDYKFTIAFENGSHPGYTTEKLTDPMLVNSLPLYWGNPRVDIDFNVASFVHFQDGSLDDFVEQVIEIDRDPDLFARYVGEPWLLPQQISEYPTNDRLMEWLHPILKQVPVLVSPTPRQRVAYAGWWVRHPVFQGVLRWFERRRRLYTVSRWIWRTTGMRTLWGRIYSGSGLTRPEIPGPERPRRRQRREPWM